MCPALDEVLRILKYIMSLRNFPVSKEEIKENQQLLPQCTKCYSRDLCRIIYEHREEAPNLVWEDQVIAHFKPNTLAKIRKCWVN